MLKSEQNPYHIAVLDDIQSTCQLVKLVLSSKMQCQVDTYTNARDLYHLEANQIPDLFLIDIIMDEIDGMQVAKYLKSNEATAHIPIIMFSAYGEPELRVKALKAGGIDYLDKPFYPEELVARVSSHIKIYRQNKQIAKQVDEQNALIRTLCHDLQNPLSALYSMLGYYSHNITEATDQSYEIMLKSAERSLDLIAHIRENRSLLYSDKPMSLDNYSASSLIKESIDMMTPMANAKGIRLRYVEKGDAEIHVNRIIFVNSIINNLLSNAIKFSQRDALVDILVSSEETEPTRSCLIEVRDHGIGIPKSTLEKLFEADNCMSRKGTEGELGTGYGMHLIERYVIQFGGSLHIESTSIDSGKSEHGTHVSIKIPIATA